MNDQPEATYPPMRETPMDAIPETPTGLQYRTQRVIDHKKTGERMRAYRTKCGVSLRELAGRMGFSAPYVSDLELGKRLWSEDRASKYIAALYAEESK